MGKVALDPDIKAVRGIILTAKEEGLVLYSANPYVISLGATGPMSDELKLLVKAYKPQLLSSLPPLHPCPLCFSPGDTKPPLGITAYWPAIVNEFPTDHPFASVRPSIVISDRVTCFTGDLDEEDLLDLDVHRELLKSMVEKITGIDTVPVFGTERPMLFHPGCVISKELPVEFTRMPGRIPTS